MQTIIAKVVSDCEIEYFKHYMPFWGLLDAKFSSISESDEEAKSGTSASLILTGCSEVVKPESFHTSTGSDGRCLDMMRFEVRIRLWKDLHARTAYEELNLSKDSRNHSEWEISLFPTNCGNKY